MGVCGRLGDADVDDTLHAGGLGGIKQQAGIPYRLVVRGPWSPVADGRPIMAHPVGVVERIGSGQGCGQFGRVPSQGAGLDGALKRVGVGRGSWNSAKPPVRRAPKARGPRGGQERTRHRLLLLASCKSSVHSPPEVSGTGTGGNGVSRPFRKLDCPWLRSITEEPAAAAGIGAVCGKHRITTQPHRPLAEAFGACGQAGVAVPTGGGCRPRCLPTGKFPVGLRVQEVQTM